MEESRTKIIEQAAMFRGMIITSYAQVEHLLGDMVMRCTVLEEYSFLTTDFPQRLSLRVQRVRAILAAPGRLSEARAEFETVITGLSRYEELRHFMAHGLQHVLFDAHGSHRLQYRMWRQPKGKLPAQEGMMITNIEQLSGAADEIARYSTTALHLFKRVYLAHGLQAV